MGSALIGSMASGGCKYGQEGANTSYGWKSTQAKILYFNRDTHVNVITGKSPSRSRWAKNNGQRQHRAYQPLNCYPVLIVIECRRHHLQHVSLDAAVSYRTMTCEHLYPSVEETMAAMVHRICNVINVEHIKEERVRTSSSHRQVISARSKAISTSETY